VQEDNLGSGFEPGDQGLSNSSSLVALLPNRVPEVGEEEEEKFKFFEVLLISKPSLFYLLGMTLRKGELFECIKVFCCSQAPPLQPSLAPSGGFVEVEQEKEGSNGIGRLTSFDCVL
jgi:hypothetical protein